MEWQALGEVRFTTPHTPPLPGETIQPPTTRAELIRGKALAGSFPSRRAAVSRAVRHLSGRKLVRSGSLQVAVTASPVAGQCTSRSVAMTRRVVWTAWLAVVFIPGAARAENWTQFRGSNGDGVTKEAQLPDEWSKHKNVVWKMKGPGAAW